MRHQVTRRVLRRAILPSSGTPPATSQNRRLERVALSAGGLDTCHTIEHRLESFRDVGKSNKVTVSGAASA